MESNVFPRDSNLTKCVKKYCRIFDVTIRKKGDLDEKKD
jgi:hypothetical protein